MQAPLNCPTPSNFVLKHPRSEFDTAELLRLFINSPTPELTKDEKGEEGKQWAFEVVGEEVGENGEIVYEIDWDDWKRVDGTSQTWKRNPAPHIIRTWRQIQKKQRKEICSNSLDIDLDALTGTDIHNLETSLRAQAFEEKLEARNRYNPTFDKEMHRLLAEKLDPDWHPGLRTSLSYGSSTHENGPCNMRQSTARRAQLQKSPSGGVQPCEFCVRNDLLCQRQEGGRKTITCIACAKRKRKCHVQKQSDCVASRKVGSPPPEIRDRGIRAEASTTRNDTFAAAAHRLGREFRKLQQDIYAVKEQLNLFPSTIAERAELVIERMSLE